MARASSKGKNNPAYIDGRTLKKHCCIVCNTQEIYFYSKTHICKYCYPLLTYGEGNGNWNDGVTLKTYCCMDCGNQISYPTAFYGKGRCIFCSNKGENNSMFGVHRFGDKAGNWQGGLNYLGYPSYFNKKLKYEIRERDNFKCQCCKIAEENYYRKLDIHHIDYNKENCNKTNLITLCHSCNTKANGNRDYWYAFYTYIMEEYIHG